MLALGPVVGVGEEVVRTHFGERNGDGLRLTEVGGARVEDESVVIGGVVGRAAAVGGGVVGLHHRLVRVGVENWQNRERRGSIFRVWRETNQIGDQMTKNDSNITQFWTFWHVIWHIYFVLLRNRSHYTGQTK